MVNELAEPPRPQWVKIAAFADLLQHWCTRSWAFHTVRGGIDAGGIITVFIPGLSELYLDVWYCFFLGGGILSPPGAVCSTSPSQPAISQWAWVFQTVPGGIDPGDLPFRPRIVRVVDVWNTL